MSTIAPIPWNASLIQLDAQGQRPLPGYTMSKDFGNWFQTSLVQQINNAPQFYPSVNLTGQNATIGTTPIPLPALPAGVYRITWYLEETTADGVSSALQLTISWTHNSKSLNLSGANITTDATTAVQSNSITILVDAGPISYAVTYASNTPGTMQYELFIIVEVV